MDSHQHINPVKELSENVSYVKSIAWNLFALVLLVFVIGIIVWLACKPRVGGNNGQQQHTCAMCKRVVACRQKKNNGNEIYTMKQVQKSRFWWDVSTQIQSNRACCGFYIDNKYQHFCSLTCHSQYQGSSGHRLIDSFRSQKSKSIPDDCRRKWSRYPGSSSTSRDTRRRSP
jgi:hypothetical protein